MQHYIQSFCVGVILLLSSGCIMAGQSTSYFGATLHNSDELNQISDTIDTAHVDPGPVVWGDMQTAPDQKPEDWNWKKVDALVQQAAEKNIQLVIVIWPYALWDQASCHGDRTTVASLLSTQFIAPYVPCDSEAYTTWLSAVVERYHHQVVAWEVTRQPELQTPPLAHFIGTSVEYLDLFKRTAGAIHAVDQRAKVLNGSIAGNNTESITFWGPILQQEQITGWDRTAITVTNLEAWPAIQSWLQRYSHIAPIWIMDSPEQQIIAGAEKVFYTSK